LVLLVTHHVFLHQTVVLDGESLEALLVLFVRHLLRERLLVLIVCIRDHEIDLRALVGDQVCRLLV